MSWVNGLQDIGNNIPLNLCVRFQQTLRKFIAYPVSVVNVKYMKNIHRRFQFRIMEWLGWWYGAAICCSCRPRSEPEWLKPRSGSVARNWLWLKIRRVSEFSLGFAAASIEIVRKRLVEFEHISQAIGGELRGEDCMTRAWGCNSLEFSSGVI